MNYRSVMVFGEARLVEDEQDRRRGFDALVEQLVPGRLAELRESTAKELNATALLALPIETFTTKVRTGPPADDEPDYDLDVWAGVVPVRSVIGEAEDDPKLKAGVARPAYLKQVKIG